MRSFLNRLYLVKCFRQNKPFFLISLLFIAGVIYGHKTSCEITPAVVLGMYSSAINSVTDSFLLVKVNGKPLNWLPTCEEPRRMMIFSTLAAFHEGVLAGYRSPQENVVLQLLKKHPFMAIPGKKALCPPSAYRQYLPWLLHYIQKAVDNKATRISISQLFIHYDSNNLPVADSTRQLYAFEQPPAR